MNKAVDIPSFSRRGSVCATGFLCGLIVCAFALPRAAHSAEPVLSFTGNDSYVHVGSPAPLQIPGATPFAVEGWMFLNASKTRDMIYTKCNDRSSGPYTYMFGSSNAAGFTAYTGSGGTPANTWVGVGAPILTGQWRHMAFSFDGATMSCYLDGNLQGAFAFSFTNSPTYTVKLGGYNTSTDINGMMSDIRVWDHDRSEAEIQANMNRRLDGTEAGLLAYWQLNEGSGSVNYDMTAGNSHGTNFNATWIWNEDLDLVNTNVDFLLAFPFSVANIQTGSEDFTNTNEVDVLDFPVPDGYNLYQVTESSNSSSINPAGWISTASPPATMSYTFPASDTNASVYSWFTNTVGPISLRRASDTIRFTTVKPVISARAAHNRTKMPGSPVVVTVVEIDTGTTGGTTGGQAIPIHDMRLSLLSGPDTNATPDETYITVSDIGSYQLELIVMNTAGNIATSSVCNLEVVAYAGDPFIWTSSSDSNWHNAANWDIGAIPTDGSDVIIGSGGKVSLESQTAELSSFAITNATLDFRVWDTSLRSDTLDIYNNGNLTHVFCDTNAFASNTNRVYIICSNITIHAGGKINVNEKGFTFMQGPGKPSGSDHGAGYGGRGGITLIGSRIAGTNGLITADGGYSYSTWGYQRGSGGGGRIAIHYNPAEQAIQNSISRPRLRIWANNGFDSSRLKQSYPGTIWMTDSQVAPELIRGGAWFGFNTWSTTNLVVSNGWAILPDALALNVGNTLLTTNSGICFLSGRYDATRYTARLYFSNAPSLNIGSNLFVGSRTDLTINSAPTNGMSGQWGSMVTVSNSLTVDSLGNLFICSDPTNGGSAFFQVGDLLVMSSGKINADGAGYAGGLATNGHGLGGGMIGLTNSSNSSGGGGGYGGHGGQYMARGLGGTNYGIYKKPTDLGSGGGGRLGLTTAGGPGGGMIRINAYQQMIIDGSITANGSNSPASNAGGGSGGGIYLTCRKLGGAGQVTANGGNAGTLSGAGGGGRIAILRSTALPGMNITATAVSGVGTNQNDLEDGTVYWSVRTGIKFRFH